MEKVIEKEKLYKPKEVTEILNISGDLLRKYTEHFNVQTKWTQPNFKGHRRYSKENIEELIAIRDKIQNENKTWDQVLAWRNGEEDAYFKSREEKSIIEKKMDQLIQMQQETQKKLELQEQFNQVLAQKLDKIDREKHELESYIDNSIKRRDQQLLEHFNQSQKQKKEESKKSFFFQNFQEIEYTK